MKTIFCFVLIVLQLTTYAVFAFPSDERVISSHPDNDAELVSVPLKKTPMRVATDDSNDSNDDDEGFAIGGPIGGGGIVGGGSFSGNPFGGFDILTGTGNNNFNTKPAINSWFPSTFQQPYNFNMNFGFNGFQDLFRSLWQTANSFDFGDLDTSPSAKDGEANTTSTIQIIDGKKYIVNDTVYTKVSPFGQSVYKIRTVNLYDCNDDEGKKDDVTPTPTDDEVKNVKINPEEPASSTSSSNFKNPTTSTTESLDKGSPEVLEPNNRDNEISKKISDEDNDDLVKKEIF